MFPVQIITTVDSRVVQLDYLDGRLLISSLTRTYLCDTERQVGFCLSNTGLCRVSVSEVISGHHLVQFPSSKQSQQIVKDCVYLDFEHLHRWRLYSSVGGLWWWFTTPTIARPFLMVKQDLQYFHLCPLPLVLSLGTTVFAGSLVLFSLLSGQVFTCGIR